MISCVLKLYLGDIHRPRMSAAHDGLSKVQGCLCYSLANWEDKMLRLNRSSNKTEEIPGWTTVIFQKPACLFQLDRISKTYSCPFISFSGNLRFRSSSQSRQILKCILRD